MFIRNKVFAVVLSSLVISQIVVAADNQSEFQRAFAERFAGFETIKPAILEAVVAKIPSQETSWGCGKLQCHSAIECAHMDCGTQNNRAVDFSTVGNWPLAVNANMSSPELSSIKVMIGFFGVSLPEDSDGFFRVGASPHEMANYMNDKQRLPERFTARTVSTDKLTVDDFLISVVSNVSADLPTIAYVVSNPKAQTMHVYNVVGYSGNTLLLLDTVGDGVARFKTQDVAEFVKSMDAQAIVATVQNIEKMGSMVDLRGKIERSKGRVISPDLLSKWKAFSYVTFEE